MFRDSLNDGTGAMIGLTIVVGCIEAAICIGMLDYYVN